MDNAAQVKHARNQIDKMETLTKMLPPKTLTPAEKKLFKKIVKDMIQHSILIESHKEIIIKYVQLETTINLLHDEISNGKYKYVSTINATLRLQSDILTSLNLTPQKMMTAAKYMPDKGGKKSNPILDAINAKKKK